MGQVNQRTRLAPEKRRQMILDHAADLIAEEGVATINMEQLGRRAGVSKSLLYNYFPSVTDLLKELFDRENSRLRKMQFEAAKGSNTIEQLVRNVTRVYLEYIEKRGIVLEKLFSEPLISEGSDPTEYSRQAAVDYFARILSRSFGIELEVARPAVDISFGLPAAAGHYLIRHEISRQEVEDITVAMIIASIQAINNQYRVSFKPLTDGELAETLQP